jgi:hypothetical protein
MARPIPVLTDVPADFREAWIVPRRPAVLRGAARDWPAVGRWTPATLRERIGARTVRTQEGEVPLGGYLDRLEDPREPIPDVRDVLLHVELPELSPDIGTVTVARDNWIEKEPLASLVRAGWPGWIGGCELSISRAGTRSRFVHVDRYHTHAWCAQIHGEERHWVWPPRGPFEDVDRDGRDLETLLPDEPFAATVGPGDVIFIPSGCPHTAESVTTSISTSGRFVEETSWIEFARALCAGDLLTRLRG